MYISNTNAYCQALAAEYGFHRNRTSKVMYFHQFHALLRTTACRKEAIVSNGIPNMQTARGESIRMTWDGFMAIHISAPPPRESPLVNMKWARESGGNEDEKRANRFPKQMSKTNGSKKQRELRTGARPSHNVTGVVFNVIATAPF